PAAVARVPQDARRLTRTGAGVAPAMEGKMDERHEAGSDGASTPFATVKRVATLPHRDGYGEMRIEIQRPHDGDAAIVSLRAWRQGNDAADVPCRGQGLALRGYELAA